VIEKERVGRQAKPAGRLLAVFGVSGVGKTTLITQFVREHKDWQALSASKLLAQLTHLASDKLRVSDRPRIENNQFLLAEAIHQHRRISKRETDWLLDAHSLIDNNREFVPVPTAAIALINPDSLIFVFDSAQQIRERRAADRQRQRPLLSIERIDEEQELAFQTCLQYSTELKLELCRVASNDSAAFAAAIAKTTIGTRSEA
jgi:adenylate kinase